MITARRSVPDTPSTSAWWVFESSAQRPPPESLDHPDLPQGFGSVELLGHDASHERPELGLTSRGGERGVAEVVVDVEMLVVDPHGPAHVEGHEPDHLPVTGNERELAPDHVDDVAVARCRPLEDPDGGDVHVADVVLNVQK